MSGPNVEFSTLYVRTTAEAAMWPLAIKGDGVGCPRCGTGLLVRPSFKIKHFELTELMALVEQHLPRCTVDPEEEILP